MSDTLFNMSGALAEPDIRRMVDAFYARVRQDPLLGPVFEARVAGRWPAHLDTMVGFWSRALLGAGRYAGNPRAVHAGIPDIDEHHFERWLSLFERTLSELFDAATVEMIQGRARAMAQGLMRGIANRRPGLPMTEGSDRTHV